MPNLSKNKIIKKSGYKKSLAGFLLGLILFLLVIPFGLFNSTTQAQVLTQDTTLNTTLIERIGEVLAQRLGISTEEKTERKLKESLQHAWAVAFKNSLSFFLNTLAYDTATFIASGGEGQQPLFYTDGWKEYITNLADGAGGAFLEAIGENFVGLNVCEPSNIGLKLSIGLGISEIHRPSRPNCTASEIINNFEGLASDPDFLNKFSVVFDPAQNDIGIALTAFNQYFETTAAQIEAGRNERLASDGDFKPVTEKITGNILTPGSLVREQAKNALDFSIGAETVPTGDIVADAINTFAQTLAGKLMQRLFREGLASFGSNGSSSFPNPTALFNPDSDGGIAQSGGKQAAQERFLTFLDAGIRVGGPYEVLQSLASCTNKEDPGPEECAIDQLFRLAIEQKMTLQQAIAAGYINGNAPFGYIQKDIEPSYLEGYPYRSLLILRAHRIIPVTWEIAAQLANQDLKVLPITLNKLLTAYNDTTSPYYGLVDKNWLLTAPEHICQAQGPGPIIASDQIINNERVVTRNNYCADYQSCIEKDKNGDCKYYGYCIEEKRVWDLNGENCSSQFNTCTTYQDPAGQTVSYLENSLDFNGCSADNAGCQWYCQQYNTISNEWTCTLDGENVLQGCDGNSQYWNGSNCAVSTNCNLAEGETSCSINNGTAALTVSNPCSSGSQYWDSINNRCQVSAGCTIPNGGVSCQTTGCEAQSNVLVNPSFEIPSSIVGGLAQGWTGNLAYFERVSGATEKTYSGSNSIRFFSFGGSLNTQSVISSPINLASGTYTFAGNFYNRLNLGTITVVVSSPGLPATSRIIDTKNNWQQVTFDFAGGPNTTIRVDVADQSGQVNGVFWFDDFKISTSCVIDPVRLTLSNEVISDQSKIHFDRDAQSCPADAVGCSTFISSIPNAGSNLVPNSNFNIWPDPQGLPTGWETISGHNGSYELSADSPVDGGSFHFLQNSLATDVELRTEPLQGLKDNTSYRVSMYVKANREVTAAEQSWRFQIKSQAGSQDLEVDGSLYFALNNNWQRIIFDPIVTLPDTINFRFAVMNDDNVTDAELFLDAVQIEEVITNNPTVTPYKEYGQGNLVNLKKAPDVLGCSGDYLNDPDECFNYALYCEPQEVGCNLYNPVSKGIPIPGVVGQQDYCPAECVGYNTFRQTTTYFEQNNQLAQFIPSTAAQCSAAQVGCDEFTNLDEVAAGGEGLEYFSYLRLCELPEDVAAVCQTFYTWQGSDETGFQLKSHSLSTTNSAPREAIAYDSSNNGADTNWPEAWCSDLTPGANGRPACCDTAEDVGTNPFCKEFIGIDPITSEPTSVYLIEQNTIACSSNCHPFRKSGLGEDPSVAQANCEASNGVWENGGCIYQGIPDQAVECSPQAAGCREYRGNTGGNVFVAFSDNFEDGAVDGWRYGTPSTEALSYGGRSIASESSISEPSRITTTVGELGSACDTSNATYDPITNSCVATDPANGETCLVAIGQEYCSPIGYAFNEGKTYVISFWAKSENPSLAGIAVQIAAVGANATQDFGTIDLTSDWNYYKLGPLTLEGSNPSRRIRFYAPAGVNETFFVDNIELRQLSNYSYVVKGSWNTPVSCDTNPFNEPVVSGGSPRYFLGCEAYKDSKNLTHNLKSFTNLCRTEAVGCEALIDTKNSDSPFSQEFNVNDPLSNVTVAADELIYAVNRSEYQCSASFQGCSATGFPEVKVSSDGDDYIAGYQTAYLINDPDKYSTTLCNNEEVGCQEFRTSNGYSYFKDPKNRACEYKQDSASGGFNWFLSGTTQPCPNIVTSAIDEAHPGVDPDDSSNSYAALCPANQNSCDLIIDPISSTAKNVLFNSGLTQPSSTLFPNGWSRFNGATVTGVYQIVTLQPDTIYTIAANIGSAQVQVDACQGVTSFDFSADILDILNANDTQNVNGDGVNETARIRKVNNNSRDYGARFKTSDDISCRFIVYVSGVITDDAQLMTTIKQNVSSVSLRETNLSYVLSSTVDKLSCNGVVDPEQGCVLFNNRDEVNYKLGDTDTTYLLFDADTTSAGGLPNIDCTGAVCDSNAVLKVSPDRECQQWLSCTTYASQQLPDGRVVNKCLNLTPCIELNEDGTCATTNTGQIVGNITPVSPGGVSDIQNLSGFAVAGVDHTASGFKVDGYYPYYAMQQYGETANVPNGNFESTFEGTTQPIGFTIWQAGANGGYVPWGDHRFKIESKPELLLEGNNYVSLRGQNRAQSEFIDVFGNTKYVISGWINTLDLFPAGVARAQIAITEFDHNGAVLNSGVSCINTPGCTNNGTAVAGLTLQLWDDLEVQAGQNWTYVTLDFTTGPSTGRVKIALISLATGPNHLDLAGAAYFDDINIKPVLRVAEASSGQDQNFIGRSCRLYPTANSLACEFLKDNVFYRGVNGFCVVPDPKNPNSCLQWWPVDQIKGTQVDEILGYEDRVPLFYCLETDITTTTSRLINGNIVVGTGRSGQNKDNNTSLNCSFEVPYKFKNYNLTLPELPSPFGGYTALRARKGAWGVARCSVPDEVKREGVRNLLHRDFIENIAVSHTAPTGRQFADRRIIDPIILREGGWPNIFQSGQYNCDERQTLRTTPVPWLACMGAREGNTQGAYATFDSEGYLDQLIFWVGDDSGSYTGDHYWTIVADVNLRNFQCTTLAQTVTDLGRNKAWSARVAEGSQFTVDCWLSANDQIRNPFTGSGQCGYISDYKPFGAAVFDRISNISEPLYWELPVTNLQPPYQIRAGQSYLTSDLQNLFAQSFDIWRWGQNQNYGVCQGGGSVGTCSVSGNSCSSDADCSSSGPSVCSIVSSGTCNTVSGTCSNNPEIDDCATDADCETGQCSLDSSVECSSDSTCASLINTCTSSIVSGRCELNNTLSCNSDLDCQQGSGFEIDLTSSFGWSVPRQLCSNNIRPTNVGSIVTTYTPISGFSNGGFEQWNTAVPPLPLFWNRGESWVASNANNTATRWTTGCPEGTSCLRLTNGGEINISRDFESVILSGMQAGRTYRVSFQARADQVISSSAGEWYLEFINTSVPDVGNDWQVLTYLSNPQQFLSLNTTWQQFVSNPITLRVGATDFKLSINNFDTNPGVPFYIDNIVIEEVTTATVNQGQDYCGVAPIISGMKVNDVPNGSNQVVINRSGNAKLEFNVSVDENQLPISSFRVDWGDNTEVSFSGVNLRQRPNADNPFVLDHFYDYWHLRNTRDLFLISTSTLLVPGSIPVRCGTGSCSNGGLACSANADCGSGNTCVIPNPAVPFCDVDIRIQVRDNWGWCTGNIQENGLPPASPANLQQLRWGYFAGNNSYQYGDGIDNNPAFLGIGQNDGIIDNELDIFNYYTDPADTSIPGPKWITEKAEYDCDDLDSWTRYSPNRVFQGGIRVYQR